MAQQFTSADTSINGKQGKLPTLYKEIIFPKGGIVIDYGCGNGTELLEKKAAEDGCTWYGYDLTWKPDQDALDALEKGVDLAIACNLLNVIDDDEVVKDIIKKLIENSKQTIFQVWVGDNNNIGRPTGGNKYQRNNKISWYKELIESLGYEVIKTTSKFLFCNGQLTDLN